MPRLNDITKRTWQAKHTVEAETSAIVKNFIAHKKMVTFQELCNVFATDTAPLNKAKLIAVIDDLIMSKKAIFVEELNGNNLSFVIQWIGENQGEQSNG